MGDHLHPVSIPGLDHRKFLGSQRDCGSSALPHPESSNRNYNTAFQWPARQSFPSDNVCFGVDRLLTFQMPPTALFSTYPNRSDFSCHIATSRSRNFCKIEHGWKKINECRQCLHDCAWIDGRKWFHDARTADPISGGVRFRFSAWGGRSGPHHTDGLWFPMFSIEI
jgi:hypothetical protein